jgi:hypothetical protein
MSSFISLALSPGVAAAFDRHVTTHIAATIKNLLM